MIREFESCWAHAANAHLIATHHGERRFMSWEIKNLSKSYKEVHALDNFHLSLPQGKVAALLGPNGAGKSTAIKILVSLLHADSGVFMEGDKDLLADPYALRKTVGYVSQELAMDKALTGWEFMRFCSGILHLPWREVSGHAADLIKRMDLEAAKDRQVGKYSGGMKRRLDLASALLHRPRLLILDEPTNGLDLEARELIWNEIQQFLKEGGTVLLVSHDFREVDTLADALTVLQHGKVAASGTKAELCDKLGSFVVHLKSQAFMDEAAFTAMRNAFSDWGDQVSWLPDPEQGVFAYRAPAEMKELQDRIYATMQAANLEVQALQLNRPDVENVYRFALGGAA
jgi:ABC-2 type transport system ATP-binding protein